MYVPSVSTSDVENYFAKYGIMNNETWCNIINEIRDVLGDCLNRIFKSRENKDFLITPPYYFIDKQMKIIDRRKTLPYVPELYNIVKRMWTAMMPGSSIIVEEHDESNILLYDKNKDLFIYIEGLKKHTGKETYETFQKEYMKLCSKMSGVYLPCKEIIKIFNDAANNIESMSNYTVNCDGKSLTFHDIAINTDIIKVYGFFILNKVNKNTYRRAPLFVVDILCELYRSNTLQGLKLTLMHLSLIIECFSEANYEHVKALYDFLKMDYSNTAVAGTLGYIIEAKRIASGNGRASGSLTNCMNCVEMLATSYTGKYKKDSLHDLCTSMYIKACLNKFRLRSDRMNIEITPDLKKSSFQAAVQYAFNDFAWLIYKTGTTKDKCSNELISEVASEARNLGRGQGNRKFHQVLYNLCKQYITQIFYDEGVDISTFPITFDDETTKYIEPPVKEEEEEKVELQSTENKTQNPVIGINENKDEIQGKDPFDWFNGFDTIDGHNDIFRDIYNDNDDVDFLA